MTSPRPTSSLAGQSVLRDGLTNGASEPAEETGQSGKLTSSPLRPTSSRDEVEGLNSSSSLVPGVYTGTRTKSDQGAGRGATSSPDGPEHFAAIVNRHFTYLRELTMTATAQPSPHGAPWDPALDKDDTKLMSAEDHYRAGSELLARAEDDAYDLPASHRLKCLAETHGVLGLLAVALWPVPDPENRKLTAEIDRLREELRLR